MSERNEAAVTGEENRDERSGMSLNARPGEALRPLRPWPELKSANFGVARQKRVVRMAVANVASVPDVGDSSNQPCSFLQLSRTEVWPIEASISECSTSLV